MNEKFQFPWHPIQKCKLITALWAAAVQLRYPLILRVLISKWMVVCRVGGLIE